MDLLRAAADSDLSDRLLKQDVPAHTELYNRYSDRVYAHLLHRTGPVEAEDLTVEVFLIAWRRASDLPLDPERGLLPWLLVCANNLLKNQARSLRRSREALSRVPRDLLTTPDTADRIVERLDSIRRIEKLRAILNKLDEGERELVLLSAVQGLSPAVIARATGEPPGTVRSRLSRALSKLRRLYGPYPEAISPTQFGDTT
jgi:RNA polymerase sigma factor (sigma-70 family)